MATMENVRAFSWKFVSKTGVFLQQLEPAKKGGEAGAFRQKGRGGDL